MDKQKSIFRKKALERLSSPEQLDSLVKIVSPKSWLALAALLILIGASIVWGLFGSIPQKVTGSCVLVKTGGIIDVTANSSGRVIDISVISDDIITAGQVIGRIEQTDLRDEIFLLREKERELQIKNRNLKDMRVALQDELKTYVGSLKSILKSEQQLSERGIVSKRKVLETQEIVRGALTQVKQADIDQLEAQQELGRIQRNLAILLDKYEYKTQIISPATGRVIEIKVTQGNQIENSTPILSIEPTGKHIEALEAVIYVSALDGKKISPGMKVNISPSTVRKEEYGTLLGKVTSVSKYPATFQAIMNVLNNEELVKHLLRKGAVFQVRANLTPNTSTTSGYKWTSPDGPPIVLQSGTLGESDVTIRKKRPISLILPVATK